MVSGRILKKKVAWGITGSGDDIDEIIKVMKEANARHGDVEVRAYVSKAGEQVLKMYSIFNVLQKHFTRVKVEKNSNTPFLVGELQTKKYDFVIVAPASSNTTAKIALGIGDTLISNAVSMATKAKVPVYILPCDVGESSTITMLPNGSTLELKIRKIDSKHIRELRRMEEITVIDSPIEIMSVFKKYYTQTPI
jgi:archaeoflavoprotein AfpA